MLWVGCSLHIANLFPWTRQLSYQIADLLRTSLIYPMLTLGKKAYSVTDLLILGVVLMGWVLLASTLSNLFKTRILSLANIARGPQETITTLARYSLILLGSIMLLQAWGIDISSLAILASVFGLGIGLGLQNIAKNFSSGLVLVLERPIQVGDFIEVGNHKGTVERIGARSTQIRTLDYISIIVPNSRFLEDEVINWSHDTPMSRLHLPVGVAYGSDPKEVEAALLAVAHQHPQVIDFPAPQVMFIRFGDSALDFELLVWTQDPSKELSLKSELYFQIHDILRQKQIEIPFPQRDLHIRSSSLSAIEVKKILEQIATSSESDRPQT
jgi:small-conductance mechanosensitive channel